MSCLRAESSGKKAILERHLRRAAIVGQHDLDPPSFVKRCHKRLVAVDVFLLSDRRLQGLEMPIVGRADMGDVDIRILGDGAIIGRGNFGPGELPGLLGRLRPCGNDMRDRTVSGGGS